MRKIYIVNVEKVNRKNVKTEKTLMLTKSKWVGNVRFCECFAFLFGSSQSPCKNISHLSCVVYANVKSVVIFSFQDKIIIFFFFWFLNFVNKCTRTNTWIFLFTLCSFSQFSVRAVQPKWCDVDDLVFKSILC